MLKAVFITNIPAHYRVAMLNKAYYILKDHGIELNVVFSSLTYERRKYWDVDTGNFRFPFFVLEEKGSVNVSRNKLFETGIGLRKTLARIKPDAVAAGGFSLSTLNALRFARNKGVPFAIYSGETNFTASSLKWMFIRNLLRKYLIKRTDHFIVYGSKAAEYINSFGITYDNISIAINSIDTDKFTKKLEACGGADNNGTVSILFVGDLRKHKGLEHLIKSLQLLKENNFILNVIGGGEESENLSEYVRANKIEYIKFEGAVNHNDIHVYYKNSDIFVLPSTFEHFGLVLIEAACAGLPLIGTVFAGASYDVIVEGKNGFIVNPLDHGEFSGKLRNLIKDRELRNRMRSASLDIIRNKVNIDLSGEGFAEGIIKCMNGE